MDPFSILMAAQAAVSFIKKGTEALHAGRMQLEGAKKTVEGVIDDVKALSGLWSWFVGLFKSEEKQAQPVAQKKAAAVSKKKQESYQELEIKLINDIGEQIGQLFDAQQQITNYYRTLEEESKTTFNPEQNNSRKAMERTLITLQMEQMMVDVREALVYSPPMLKDLYTRFLVMHGQIEREQEWARAEMIRRARVARWRKEQYEIHCIELTSAVFAVVFISLFFGWFMWALRNLSGGF